MTDHGENLGLYVRIAEGDPRVAGSELADRWSGVLELVQQLGLRDAFRTSLQKHGPMPQLPAAIQQDVWREVTQIADQYNQPGRFAALAEGSNRHRNRELGAAGLAAVWAAENTREAIFDAIRRREVYATTGSRIRLRLFAGWDFVESDIDRHDYARHAYSTGVPMGSDLPARELPRDVPATLQDRAYSSAVWYRPGK